MNNVKKFKTFHYRFLKQIWYIFNTIKSQIKYVVII